MHKVFLVSLCLVNTVTWALELLDQRYAGQTYYYDLSYVNSQSSEVVARRDRAGTSNDKESCNSIKRISNNLRYELKLSYFYQKYNEAYGIPVIGSNKVSYSAMRRACYSLRFYLAGRADLRELFYKRGVRVVVIATGETVISVPEYATIVPNSWSNLVRGLSPTSSLPIVAVTEENLLCGNDKFREDDLIIHELSYGLVSLNMLSGDLKTRLDRAFERAKSSSLWKSMPLVLLDQKEYLATAIDIYLNASSTIDEETLRSQDADVYRIVREIFPCDNSFANKCHSNRESELSQTFKLNDECSISQDLTNSRPRDQTQPMSTIRKSTTSYYTTQRPTTTSTQRSTTQSTTTTTTTTTTTRRTTSRLTTSRFVPDEFFNKVFQENAKSPGSSRPSESRTNSWTPLPTSSRAAPSTRFSSSSTFRWTSPTTQSTTTTSTLTTPAANCEDLNTNCAIWAAKGHCDRNKQYMNMDCKKSCNFCNVQRAKPTTRRITTTTVKFDISYFENLCKDEDNFCYKRAEKGECKTDPHYMLQKCKRSCNLCGDLAKQKEKLMRSSTRRTPINYPTPAYTTTRRVSGSTTSTTTSRPVDDNAYKNNAFLKFLSDDSIDENQDEEYEENEQVRPTEATTTTAAQVSACKDLIDYCNDYATQGECKANVEVMRHYCPLTCKLCHARH